MDNSTIEYYNSHADIFSKDTVSVEFSKMRRRFTEKLPEKAFILDFGCGSGRDTKAFLEQGYRVEAVDGSRELCQMAEEYTGIVIRNMMFQDLRDIGRYDGIWACASVLHLPKPELAEVLRRMEAALKERGLIYISFKYGNFEGTRNGRYFTDLTETSFMEMIRTVDHLRTEEQWITSDARPGRGNEKWLNLILRKL